MPAALAFPHEDLDLVLSLTPGFWSRFNGARLFITGGTGFIGTWVLQALQRANDTLGSRIELVVLTRDPGAARTQAPHIFCRLDTTLMRGDVKNFNGLVGPVDLCIHAATDVGNPHENVDPLKTFDSIVQGTRRMVDLAHSNGASRFLLMSSGAVYGPQPTNMNRITESYTGAPDSLQPVAAYANGKRAAEWLACTQAANASHAGFDLCIARIFALIGPGMPLNSSFAAGNFVRDALLGRSICVEGDGRPLRSYLYMADLCVWLLRILDSGTAGQAYNVGSEKYLSISKLAEQVLATAGTNAPVKVLTPANSDTPVPRYVPDTSKARRELHLAEYTSLNSALRKTLHWHGLGIPT